MLVRPIRMAPAARSRATTGASHIAGGWSSSAFEPARVGSPATSKRSLIDTGKPAKGDGDIPRLAQAVLRVGGGASAILVDPDKAAPAFARGIGDPRQRRLDQRAAGGAPGRQILGETEDGRLQRSGRGHGITSNSRSLYLISPSGGMHTLDNKPLEVET